MAESKPASMGGGGKADAAAAAAPALAGVAESRALEAIEGECQEVLAALAGDKALERFRLEYERLYRALKKSHDNEKRLARKCRELNGEIVANAAKVQTALSLGEEDQATILALRREIERAWKAVDAAHGKEAKAREAADALRAEVAELTRLAEAGSALSLGKEATAAELTRERDEAARERDAHAAQVLQLRADLMEGAERLRRGEAERAALEADVASLRQQVADKRAEAEREARRRERLERDARDLRAAAEAKGEELRARALDAQGAEEQAAKLEALLKDARAATERVQKEANALAERVAKLHAELQEAARGNAQLLADAGARQVELRAREQELADARAELAKAVKLKDATLKRAKELEDARAQVEAERDSLKAAVASLERNAEDARRAADAERRRADALAHERDLLDKLRGQADGATQRQGDLVRLAETAKRSLEAEVASYRQEAQRAARALQTVDREREKHAADAAEAQAKHGAALDEVRVRDAALVELHKRVADGDAKLRQQQALYEAVRADRNAASKALIEAQDEIAELRRRFKILGHQVEQLKGEVGAKDLALVKEHFDHLRADKEKEALRLELGKVKAAAGEAEAAIAAQAAQLEKLGHVVAEADAERARQAKELSLVLGERDVLGTQLIRRNDELALLYEKVKLQQSALARGQLQYRDRLSEIRVLKVRLADLRRELHVLRTGVAGVDVLKREVAALSRALLQERAKVRALGDELETPLNVHRWRKLEGSDPSTYELILKIQALQRRLIAKTEEVAERDLLLQEKERLYVELRQLLARQPGPEAAEQLGAYQAALRDKTKQLKALASELNMCQAQAAEHRADIERLQRELAGYRRQWVDAARRRGGGGVSGSGGSSSAGCGGGGGGGPSSSSPPSTSPSAAAPLPLPARQQQQQQLLSAGASPSPSPPPPLVTQLPPIPSAVPG